MGDRRFGDIKKKKGKEKKKLDLHSTARLSVKAPASKRWETRPADSTAPGSASAAVSRPCMHAAW